MKKIIQIAIIFLLTGIAAPAQIQEKIFYDSHWYVVESASKASFYRLVTLDENGRTIGKLYDYFITGELQSEADGATYIDKKYDSLSKFIGKAKGVTITGKKDFETIYDSLSNLTSKKTWYENGSLATEYMINGAMETVTSYYDNGNKYIEATYKNGVYDGIYSLYYSNGKLKSRDEYSNGYKITGTCIECDEFGQCKTIFYEKFNSVASMELWPSFVNEEVTAQMLISGEGYQIENKIKAGVSFRIYKPIDISNNFSMETVIEFKKGDKTTFHGLQFGFLDWENYSYFYISAKGEYRIGHVIDGLGYYGTVIKSSLINKGNIPNLIKISMYDNQMHYAINGQIVHGEPFVRFKGNSVGFTAGGKSEVLFKSLTIKETMANGIACDWKGNGSGFFIDTTGLIATNYHVIDGAKQIEVTFLVNGLKKAFKADVISIDKKNDLAIIKINDTEFTHFKKLPYGFKNKVSDVGSSIFAMGFPMALNSMGEEVKFNDGKISAKSGFQGDINTYQISVPIQPGNSGGPLFDYDGNIIGIVNSKLTAGDNVAYAIKESYLNSLIETLPFEVSMDNCNSIASQSLTEKIKSVSDYIVLVKTK
jgi:hypothetical protein